MKPPAPCFSADSRPVSTLPKDLWIFGYGSLIWKNDEIPHTDSLVCFARGFKRRAWQGSTDHRGTPDRPGRVVSLYTPRDFEQMRVMEKDQRELSPGAAESWQVCGVAFKVTDEHRETVIESLNYRERDGYQAMWLPLYSCETATSPPRLLITSALTYVAGPSDPSFLGFATSTHIAKHISSCRGLSGPNIDYITNLNDSLNRLGYPDSHLASIVDAIAG